MTRSRRLPPVHSPVNPGATVRALLAGRRRSAESTAKLEALLAERFSADNVVLCASGTHALQLAFTMATRSTGRGEVALPAFSCYDLVSAALGADVRPVFYDVDASTLQPDGQTLIMCLERRPAAVVVVHQFGLPAALETVVGAARDAGTLVVEDAAQAHGGSVNGRPLGSLAPVSVLSFGRGKGWTGGGGGALLLRGANAVTAWSEARLGLEFPPSALGVMTRLLGQWLLGRPALYSVAQSLPGLGLGKTHFVPPTRPAAMQPSSARLVLDTLRSAEREAAARRGTAALFRQRLAALGGVWLPPEPAVGSVAGYLRMPARVPGRNADEVVGEEARRLGILPSYPRTLPSLPQALGGERDGPPTPGAETLARELFTVPVHHWVKGNYVDTIVAAISLMTGPRHGHT